MQRKIMLRNAAGLSLLALAGCGSQPEEPAAVSTTTTTVITAPTSAPSTVVVRSAPPIVVSGGDKTAPPTKMAAKPTAKPVVVVKPTLAPKKTAPPKVTASSAGKLGPIPKSTTILISEDMKIGVGPEAQAGKKVIVHYTGTLTDGTKFDSSLDRGTPFDFTLGAQQVIAGWDQGVAGMKVGGKRRLIIPSDMAYGPSGQGSIPPDATLVFTVELLGVE